VSIVAAAVPWFDIAQFNDVDNNKIMSKDINFGMELIPPPYMIIQFVYVKYYQAPMLYLTDISPRRGLMASLGDRNSVMPRS